MAKNNKKQNRHSGKKSGGVSVANILSTLGFGIFGLLTFFGYQMIFKGDTAQAIIFTAASIAVVGIFLWFLMHAKTRDNDAKKWFVVEVSTGVVLVALVVLFGAKPVLHSASIINGKEQLLQALEADRQEVENIFQDFNKNEDRLLEAMSSSRSVFPADSVISIVDAESAESLQMIGLADINGSVYKTKSVTRHTIDSTFSEQYDALRGEIFGNINEKKDSIFNRINKIKIAVNDMDFFTLPVVATEMDKINGELAHWFNEHSSQPGRFEVKKADGKLKTVPLKYTYEKLTSLKFQDTLAGSSGGVKITVLGVVLLVLSLLLIYLPYLLCKRTLILPITKSKINDGGVNLFD